MTFLPAWIGRPEQGAISKPASKSRQAANPLKFNSLIKPFAFVLPGMDTLPALLWYFSNFVNLISLLKAAPGSRFLDVACGGGWISPILRHARARANHLALHPIDWNDSDNELDRSQASALTTLAWVVT